jgi:hypothetical protein
MSGKPTIYTIVVVLVFVFLRWYSFSTTSVQKRHEQGDGDGKAQRYCCVTVPVNVRDRMFKDAAKSESAVERRKWGLQERIDSRIT